mgnify:CR=1 FL=1
MCQRPTFFWRGLDLATAASFTTNTNWQSYAGEATLSNLVQALGLAAEHHHVVADLAAAARTRKTDRARLALNRRLLCGGL